MVFEQRAEALKRLKPHLVVNLHLYATADGGRRQPVPPGWGCPCSSDRKLRGGWDGNPMLGDDWMYPGETRRRVGYFFLSGEEAVAALSRKPKFYLWENRIIGEAEIVPG